MSCLYSVCILAGGRGTRLGPLTDDMPKPLVEVAGEPFLCHQLRLLAGNGASDVVLCVGYRGEMIEAALGERKFGIRLRYSYDAMVAAGTLGAIRQAAHLLDERFLVLYGDTYLPIDFSAAQARWEGSGLPAMMTVLRNDGRWGTSNVKYLRGKVVAHDKAHPTDGMRWIDYGLGGLSAELVDMLPSQTNDLSQLYAALARTGELCGVPVTRRFHDIGTPLALRETSHYLSKLASRTNRDRASAEVCGTPAACRGR